MKDPHTLFFPICYTRFTFTQRMALYATASDGTHRIKVFKDSVEPENDDCEVVQVDGVAAIDAITTFARDKVFISKDLGVRLNMALASLSLQGGTYSLLPRSSQFTLRSVLPEKETTTYELKCGTKTKTVQRKWEAVMNNLDDLDNFTDAKSYWKSFCANPSAGKKRKRNSGRAEAFTKSYNTADPLAVNPEILKELSPSVEIKNLVFDAKTAQFYMSENNVGVAVLASFFAAGGASDTAVLNTVKDLRAGFNALADKGAKKLILDMTNNEGGFTSIAHFINSLLFPNSNPSLPTNFRLSDITKKSILKASDGTADSIFNKDGYLRVDEQPFDDVNEFLESKFIENDLDSIKKFLAADNKTQLPWNSSDMMILTNGFCGSACASTALLLSELHKVQSVAVGGFPDVPLSFTSFAGGQNFLFEDPLKRGFDLKTDCGALEITNDPEFPKDFPTNVLFTFTVRRSFSDINSVNSLEYSFKPSTNHIFYDEESIRDPSKLWSLAINS